MRLQLLTQTLKVGAGGIIQVLVWAQGQLLVSLNVNEFDDETKPQKSIFDTKLYWKRSRGRSRKRRIHETESRCLEIMKLEKYSIII